MGRKKTKRWERQEEGSCEIGDKEWDAEKKSRERLQDTNKCGDDSKDRETEVREEKIWIVKMQQIMIKMHNRHEVW